MKVVLSRKGFDSSTGGHPNPVFDDATMLALPIPSKDLVGTPQEVLYSDLWLTPSISYDDIYKALAKKEYKKGSACHLDPDLFEVKRSEGKEIKDWRPAFGLSSDYFVFYDAMEVGIGDLILFFSWFKPVQIDDKGKIGYRRKKKSERFSDFHALYGYMQIGDILFGEELDQFAWHPHAWERSKSKRLYLPAEKLEIPGIKSLPGFGRFRFAEDLILTKEGCTKSRWTPEKWLSESESYCQGHTESPTDFMESDEKNGEYYNTNTGFWQERILIGGKSLEDKVGSLFANHANDFQC